MSSLAEIANSLAGEGGKIEVDKDQEQIVSELQKKKKPKSAEAQKEAIILMLQKKKGMH